MTNQRRFLGRLAGVVLAMLLANIWGYPPQSWPGRY